MAQIDFGSGPNTATGDTVAQALAKLQARLDALGSGTSAPPTGFTLNGSTNPALKAMLASGNGLIVFKGDSTVGAGAGAALAAGPGTLAQQLTNARPYRPSAVFAAEMTAAGYPMTDNGFVGDQGLTVVGAGVALASYDPHISFKDGSGAAATPWSIAGGQGFAGGGYIDPGTAGSILTFAPGVPVTSFEAVAYNVGGTFGFAVNGAAAIGITAPGATVSGNNVTMPSNAGFTRITVPAGVSGTHVLGAVAAIGNPLLRSARGVGAGVGIVNHGSCGATAAAQATSNAGGSGWSNNDALGFDAPKLTIIPLGLNDAAGGVSASSFTTSNQAMITKAKLSGDVLLVTPHWEAPAQATLANQTALRDAAAALAASAGVAYMDFQAYYTSFAAMDAAAMFANAEKNHVVRSRNAEEGSILRRCVQAMVA